MIEVRCTCGQTYHADDSHAGRSLRCTKCGKVLTIEHPRTQSANPLEKIKPATVDISAKLESPHIAVRSSRSAYSNTRKLTLIIVTVASVVVVLAWYLSKKSNQVVQPTDTQERQEPIAAIPACAEGQPIVRPSTGDRIDPDELKGGRSTLIIRNGTAEDAVVLLADSHTSRTARFVYIRAGENFQLSGIKPSSYRLVFETGSDWVAGCRDFLKDSSYTEFVEDVVFRFSRTVDEDLISTWVTHGEITLNPVVGGNAKVRTIDRKRFLDVGRGS